MFELHQTKTKKGKRDIPLTDKAVQALQNQKLVKQSIIDSGKEPLEGFEELVFVTKNNRPTTQFLVSECMDGVMKKIHKKYPDLIFEKITPHCFRHTFATRYLEAGVPFKVVSELLGHTQLQLTTDLYMHATNDFLLDWVERYEQSVSAIE